MTEMGDGQKPPAVKKARYMSTWETSLTTQDPAEMLGLQQLFGGRRHGHARHASSVSASQDQPEELRNANQNARHVQRFLDEQQRDGFFTLRLEHRVGGAIAQHVGEERILLFRSDRAGAIAKIIFSSTPFCGGLSASGSSVPDNDEAELHHMAQARIHVLEVKAPYRGFDLGGLLFSEAVRLLRRRYSEDQVQTATSTDHDAQEYALSRSVRCQLDAEEDIRRHNKLVGFYENLGCHVKPTAKVRYINNNDGETYRKIAMQVALRPNTDSQQQDGEKRPRCVSAALSVFDQPGSFLPIRLFEASGRSVQLHSRTEDPSRRVDWLLLDDGEGRVSLRTTHGDYLQADPNGRCRAIPVSGDEDAIDDADEKKEEWANFRLHRVSDALRTDEFSSDESDTDALSNARQKQLWMLKSAHGGFLATDAERHTLYCSRAPAFWQADDESLSLTCTTDTPPRRQHYRRAWTKQTVAYVQSMRERFLSFNLKKMSIHYALNLASNVPFNRFRIGRSRSGQFPSLRTLCYRTAEACRAAGHPDWIQFVGLVHGLAQVLNFVDMATAAESEDGYDWTVTSRSRIVGCASPDQTTFSEFRGLNVNEKDSRYNTHQGMYNSHCGLDSVLVTWTGPEYMYHMLRHNKTTFPEEGLAMLRYFSLLDWHSRGEYSRLTNADDADVREFVAEFDHIRRSVRREHGDGEDMSDEECDKLWREYYTGLVAKYVGNGDLMW